jgi:hypothetical protein
VLDGKGYHLRLISSSSSSSSSYILKLKTNKANAKSIKNHENAPTLRGGGPLRSETPPRKKKPPIFCVLKNLMISKTIRMYLHDIWAKFAGKNGNMLA